jgi:hypothetical protein
MFEIYFIFFFLPRKMSRLAKERNQSAIAWSLMAIGAWVLAETVVLAVIEGFAMATGEADQQGWYIGLGYVASLVAALVAADLVRRKLQAMPVTKNECP